MRDVYVVAAHTIKFGEYLEKTISDLSAMTVISCLKEATMCIHILEAPSLATS